MDFINSTGIAVASSPGTDTSGVALILLCQLFGFVKEWLQVGGAPMNNDKPNVENEVMISDVDCKNYRSVTRHYSDDCESNSTVYDYDVDLQHVRKFMRCLTYNFMTEVGANSSCMNNSVRSDNNTNIHNTLPLFTKDHIFYSFMTDTLNMTTICSTSNNTLMFDLDTNATIFSYDNCDFYFDCVKNKNSESKCVHNTSAVGSDRELPYDKCLFYRFMKRLGADSGCSEHFALRESCELYRVMMRIVVATIICIIGLIGNSISLAMFCRGLVKTPTTYQLQWLAVVDITLIVTYWLASTLQDVISYANVTSDFNCRGICAVLFACLAPLWWVAKSCSVWLTVFIGMYRYLAVCKPYSNVYSHAVQHGQKYVKLIVTLSFLYNSIAFIEYQLELYEEDGQIYIRYRKTGLLSNQFYYIYYSYVTGALVICLPLIILCFVTVSILAELQTRQKKKSNMQTSSASQTSITVVLISILVIFIICQIPYFLYWSISTNSPSLTHLYGSFRFYLYHVVNVGLLLNSSVNGFIYFFLNKSFRDAFCSRCQCKWNNGTESIDMGPVSIRMSRPREEML